MGFVGGWVVIYVAFIGELFFIFGLEDVYIGGFREFEKSDKYFVYKFV